MDRIKSTTSKRHLDAELENLVVLPPDGGWGWVVVFSAFINNMIVDGITYTFGIMINELSLSFNTTVGKMSVAQAIMASLSFGIGPFVSALLNKFDFRWVALMGALVGASGYTLCSLVHEYPHFLVGYGILLGLGLGLLYVPTIVVVGLYFAKWRALAAGIATCGSGFGTLGLPPLIKYLFDTFGWRTTFQIFIGIILLTGVSSLTFLPLNPHQAITIPAKSDMVDMDDDEGRGCCACCACAYNNKYYPTTAEMAPENAELISTGNNIVMYSKVSIAATRQSTMSRRYLSTLSFEENKCRYYWYSFLNFVCCGQCQTDTRAMYRDDIFYAASVMKLPKYKELEARHRTEKAATSSAQAKKKESLVQKMKHQEQVTDKAELNKIRLEQLKKYHMSVTRATDVREFDEHICSCCALSCIRTLTTMLDFRLLKSPAFQLFAWSGLFAQFGFTIPYLFMKDRAIAKFGIPDELAIWLVSVTGIANTVGRIVCGVLPSVFNMNVTIYSYSCLFVVGILTACSGFYGEIWFQFGYVACFGFLTACIATLRPIIVVELFGLENLTNAFGLQLIFMAFSAAAGPVVAGLCYDLTQDYNIAFYLAGANFVMTSLLMIGMESTRNWEKRTERINI